MIVGIHGRKRSGKDFTADHLVRYGYNKMAFATYLKEGLRYALETNKLDEAFFLTDLDSVLEGKGFDRELALPLTKEAVYKIICSMLEYFGLKQNALLKGLLKMEDCVIVNGKAIKEWSIRAFLKHVATDIVQEIDKNYFAEYLLSQIDYDANTVISDVRFDHEIKVLQELNAVFVSVDSIDPSHDNHISEKCIEIEGAINIFNDKTENFISEIETKLKELICHK